MRFAILHWSTFPKGLIESASPDTLPNACAELQVVSALAEDPRGTHRPLPPRRDFFQSERAWLSRARHEDQFADHIVRRDIESSFCSVRNCRNFRPAYLLKGLAADSQQRAARTARNRNSVLHVD